MKKFILYHLNPNVNTLAEFCETQGIHFDSDNSTREDKYQLKDFFDDNRDRILSQMSVKERRDYIVERGIMGDDNNYKTVDALTADDLVIDMKIPCPIKLVIDDRFVSYTISAKHNTFQEMTNNVTAFEDENIRDSLINDIINFKQARRRKPSCSVIGFFKSIFYNKKENDWYQRTSNDSIYQMKSNFIDISKFVTSLSTSVSVNGGTFSIQLPHIPFYTNQKNLQSVKDYPDNSTNVLQKLMDADGFSEAYNLSDYPVFKSSMDNLDYWVWLISTNDLIFISFHEIENIDDDNIANNSFDMIGLVENVSINRDANGNITINVSGKDLMKLLSDDSSLFFPTASVFDQGNFFDNVEGALRMGDISGVDTINGRSRDKQQDGAPMRMPGPDGMIRLFREECNGFTIDYIIKVAISALANIQICPSEIFSSWGDKVTTFAYLTPEQDKNNKTNE